MFFSDVANSGNIPAIDAMLSFTHAQHRVLAENIANIDTPGYKTKQLDPKRFQKALASAVSRQREERSGGGLRIESSQQFDQDESGRLRFSPTLEPAENVLFHDQTNARIERQMSLLAENAMMHQTLTQLLAGRYESLKSAIRGRVV